MVSFARIVNYQNKINYEEICKLWETGMGKCYNVMFNEKIQDPTLYILNELNYIHINTHIEKKKKTGRKCI